MTCQELDSFYPQDYKPHSGKRGIKRIIFNFFTDKKIKAINKAMSSNNGHLYEIGAGSGAFLNRAKEYGFVVNGVDASPNSVKTAKDLFNIELQQGYANDVHFLNQYNVVAMLHVLEHINATDTIKLLSEIYKNGLCEGGLLYIEIPIIDCKYAHIFGRFYSHLDMPRHRTHYTKKGLITILERVGFKVVSVNKKKLYSSVLYSSLINYANDERVEKPLLRKLINYVPSLLMQMCCTLHSVLTWRNSETSISVIAMKKASENGICI